MYSNAVAFIKQKNNGKKARLSSRLMYVISMRLRKQQKKFKLLILYSYLNKNGIKKKTELLHKKTPPV